MDKDTKLGFKVIVSPVGLIILGIVFIIAGVSEIGAGGIILGVIIFALGILRFILKRRKVQKFFDDNLPIYNRVVDALKERGYEVKEVEHKRNEVRSDVYLNGNCLGTVFLISPFQTTYDTIRETDKKFVADSFDRACNKKFKKSLGMPTSFWPDNSPMGASIFPSADFVQEKEEWLSYMATMYKDN